MTKATLEAYKTSNLPLLQSIAKPKGTTLPNMLPSKLIFILTKLSLMYKMLKTAARKSQI
jgi:hypothetical protein